MRKTLMLVLVVFAAGVPLAVTQEATAQESKLSEKQKGQLIKRFPKSAETKTFEADSEITATGERDRPLLGVQRWDMFSGKGATQQKELGYLPGKQGFLKDSQWHDRVPFFCRLTKDVDWIEHPANAGPVWFNHPFSQQLLQESMDQELRYAHNAGIDFFVYHGPARKLYANGWELRNNFDCHLSSKIPEAKKVNFTWALYAHRAIGYTRSKVATMMDETIEYIKMPNWQTVMDGRPLIVVYHPERFRAALQVAQGKEHMTGAEFVDYVRTQVEAAGLKTPYIVGCMEPRDSFMHAETLKEEGYDAFMDYEGAYGGAVAKRDEAPTYASATEEILKTCEQEYLNRGLPFLPPCPSMHYRWPHAFDRKGQAIEKLHHFQWPKEGDLEARVEAVLDFVASHPEDCEAQTVIMYSWNEHSGGGGICPTMGKSPEYEPETQWLDEVAEALAAWKYPQKADSERPANKAVVYKTIGERQLKMHVDFPPGWKKTDTRPVIVFFHGGGWNGGSVQAFARQAEYFASRGLVCARAEYRIKTKDGVTPDKCVEDARSAIRWVRANSAELGIDPQKLITAGGSAGGHLAACAIIPKSVEAEDADLSISTNPQAMVLFNPVLSFMHGGLVSRVNGDKEIAEKISPLLYVKADTAPSIVMFGTKDRLKAFGDLWWAKAEEIGFRADKYTAEGEGHGFFNQSPWMERTTIAADKFLASLGYLDGEPTMEVPTGEKLKALQAEQEKKSAAGKLNRKKKNQALKAEQDKKAKERGKQ